MPTRHFRGNRSALIVSVRKPTFKRLIAHCSLGAALLAGWTSPAMSQVIWPGQITTIGPASPLAHDPRWPSGRPVGLGEAARAASAAGRAPTNSPARTPAADNATYIEFDVPGSACEAPFPRCTTPNAINPAGVVTGYYADANAALHGFVRNSDGSFILFDGPGAACPSFFSACTVPSAINPQGAITGTYCDAVTCHGFVRAPDGTITTLDPPGSLLTFANSINPAGTVVGGWFDANFALHGFLTTDGSTFTSFDVPGAVNGTNPIGIDQTGAVVGSYFDLNFQSHGFVRAGGGAITTFDPAGSIFTAPVAISPDGTIVGSYQVDVTFVTYGFLRSKHGAVTTFDVGGSQTLPSSINPGGTVTGNYDQLFVGLHAFIRDKNGAVTTFDPPGSNPTVPFTFANGINPAGVITGWYIDPSFLGHGFIRIPH